MSIFGNIAEAARTMVEEQGDGTQAPIAAAASGAVNGIGDTVREMSGKLHETATHMVEALEANMGDSLDELPAAAETGSAAAAAAAALSAEAYADGEDVIFVEEIPANDVMSHEAVHVVQGSADYDEADFVSTQAEAPAAAETTDASAEAELETADAE